MKKMTKNLSNPFSTGGGGHTFEIMVQTSFAVLMLTGGLTPCLPLRSIQKIKLQGRFKGYDTDDMIVFTSNPGGSSPCKLLAQIKHQFSFTAGSEECKKVLASAWADFQNDKLFTRNRDAIAIITGPISQTDINYVRPTLERARATEDAAEFFIQINLWNFTHDTARTKLQVIRDHINAANGSPVTDEDTWLFLRHLHLIGYDLDIKQGVIQSLIQSMIQFHTDENAAGVWGRVLHEVMFADKDAGTLIHSNFPPDLLALFEKTSTKKMPDLLAKGIAPDHSSVMRPIHFEHSNAIAIATILGTWNEGSPGDISIIKQIAEVFDEAD